MKNYFVYLLFLGFTLSGLAEPISISVKNMPTSPLIRYLAEEAEQNVVINDQIESQTTLRLINRPFADILQSIAKINQLSIKKENDIYYISIQKEPVTANLENLKPKLITKTIKLHYAKASELIETLTKGSGNFLSESGYLHFDERENSLIIKDSPKSLQEISKLIKELDKPTEQIAIEARIVTISSENLQELGVRWGLFARGEGHRAFGGRLEGNGIQSTANLNVNFPVIGGASAVLQVASINSKVLDLELSALEQENHVEIIASPRLLTTNKKQASIKQGTEIPYAMYNRNAEINDIEFKEAVLGLQVTPHIAKDRQILLDLLVTQNSPSQSSGSNSAMITIDKQELNTQVFARHGETIVLGGIFQHLSAKGTDRVPILGSIPVIKRLFSQDREQIRKRELVIFVTPYLVNSREMAITPPPLPAASLPRRPLTK